MKGLSKIREHMTLSYDSKKAFFFYTKIVASICYGEKVSHVHGNFLHRIISFTGSRI